MPVYTYRLRLHVRHRQSIMPMLTVRLMNRMDTEHILSIKQSVSIDTMINFDSDGDGHGDGDGTCKQDLGSG